MEKYSEYKNSGTHWIEKIPIIWRMVALKRLTVFSPSKKENLGVDIEVGYAPMEKVRWDNMNPTSIRVGNLSTGLTYFEEGDVVIAKVTPCFENGNIAIVPKMVNYCGYGSSELFVYRCKSSLDKRFLLYLLSSKPFINAGVATMTGTGGLKRVSSEFAKNTQIPLPPLSEQTAIVTYLDDATAKMDKFVTKKEQEIELLEKLKQRMIADAVTKGLASNAEMVPCDISWIKRIPKGWSCKRIGTQFTEVNELNTDYEFKTAFKFNYGTIASKNETGDLAEYMETYVKYLKLKTNDIVINGLNLNYDFISQRVAIVPSDGIMTSAYLALRPRMNVNAWYFNYLFKAMDFMKLFHGMGTGIRLTLSFSELKKQNLPIPPIEEQQAIVDYIKDKSEKIDKLKFGLQQEIEKVKLYKQRLISDVVTGQIKVC